MSNKKPIDKEYLVSSLKNFDKEILSKKYLNLDNISNTEQNPEDIPIGTIIPYMGNQMPAHYLLCDGTIYSKIDYPDLVQYIVEEFGSADYFGGDGINTFAVPDLRGEFLRGAGTATRDTGNGSDVGQHQDPTKIPNIYYTNNNNLILVNEQVNGKAINADKEILGSTDSIANGRYLNMNNSPGRVSDISYYTSCPTNTSVQWCIKYEHTYYIQVQEQFNVTDEQLEQMKEEIKSEISGSNEDTSVAISQISGNQLEEKEDGLYVPPCMDVDINTNIDNYIKQNKNVLLDEVVTASVEACKDVIKAGFQHVLDDEIAYIDAYCTSIELHGPVNIMGFSGSSAVSTNNMNLTENGYIQLKAGKHYQLFLNASATGKTNSSGWESVIVKNITTDKPIHSVFIACPTNGAANSGYCSRMVIYTPTVDSEIGFSISNGTLVTKVDVHLTVLELKQSVVNNIIATDEMMNNLMNEAISDMKSDTEFISSVSEVASEYAVNSCTDLITTGFQKVLDEQVEHGVFTSNYRVVSVPANTRFILGNWYEYIDPNGEQTSSHGIGIGEDGYIQLKAGKLYEIRTALTIDKLPNKAVTTQSRVYNVTTDKIIGINCIHTFDGSNTEDPSYGPACTITSFYKPKTDCSIGLSIITNQENTGGFAYIMIQEIKQPVINNITITDEMMSELKNDITTDVITTVESDENFKTNISSMTSETAIQSCTELITNGFQQVLDEKMQYGNFGSTVDQDKSWIQLQDVKINAVNDILFDPAKHNLGSNHINIKQDGTIGPLKSGKIYLFTASISIINDTFTAETNNVYGRIELWDNTRNEKICTFGSYVTITSSSLATSQDQNFFIYEVKDTTEDVYIKMKLVSGNNSSSIPNKYRNQYLSIVEVRQPVINNIYASDDQISTLQNNVISNMIDQNMVATEDNIVSKVLTQIPNKTKKYCLYTNSNPINLNSITQRLFISKDMGNFTGNIKLSTNNELILESGKIYRIEAEVIIITPNGEEYISNDIIMQLSTSDGNDYNMHQYKGKGLVYYDADSEQIATILLTFSSELDNYSLNHFRLEINEV